MCIAWHDIAFPINLHSAQVKIIWFCYKDYNKETHVIKIMSTFFEKDKLFSNCKTSGIQSTWITLQDSRFQEHCDNIMSILAFSVKLWLQKFNVQIDIKHVDISANITLLCKHPKIDVSRVKLFTLAFNSMIFYII